MFLAGLSSKPSSRRASSASEASAPPLPPAASASAFAAELLRLQYDGNNEAVALAIAAGMSAAEVQCRWFWQYIIETVPVHWLQWLMSGAAFAGTGGPEASHLRRSLAQCGGRRITKDKPTLATSGSQIVRSSPASVKPQKLSAEGSEDLWEADDA